MLRGGGRHVAEIEKLFWERKGTREREVGATIKFRKNKRQKKHLICFLSFRFSPPPSPPLSKFWGNKKRKNYFFLVVTHNNTPFSCLHEEENEWWENRSFTPFSLSVSQVLWAFFPPFSQHNRLPSSQKSCSRLLTALVFLFWEEGLNKPRAIVQILIKLKMDGIKKKCLIRAFPWRRWWKHEKSGTSIKTSASFWDSLFCKTALGWRSRSRT